MNPDHQADPSPREADRLLRWYVESDLVEAGDEFGLWDDDVREYVAGLTTRTSPQLSEGMVERLQAAEVLLRRWERWPFLTITPSLGDLLDETRDWL